MPTSDLLTDDVHQLFHDFRVRGYGHWFKDGRLVISAPSEHFDGTGKFVATEASFSFGGISQNIDSHAGSLKAPILKPANTLLYQRNDKNVAT